MRRCLIVMTRDGLVTRYGSVCYGSAYGLVREHGLLKELAPSWMLQSLVLALCH